MDVRQERCGGLDVQKREVVACLLSSVPDQAGQPRQELRRFGTMTADLERLATWLEQAGCTHVALESTGSYWQPVWHILEEHGGFTVLLVNPQHIKALGRDKTDVKDAEWLAELLRHGLLRGSFVPSAEQRRWRDLTR